MERKNRHLLLLSLLIAVFSCKRGGSAADGLANDTPDKKAGFETRKNDKDISELIRINKQQVKNGDLLERVDDDMVSESMRNFSKKDKSFSHCGIAFIEDGDVYVYNNMAGEENKSEKMMREPYDSFVSPHKKSGFGIFRYNLADSEIARLHEITKSNYAAGLRFDKTFDLKTDDKMYCAEMVLKFLKTATANRIVIPTTKLYNYRVRDPKYKGLVLKEFEYVGLDDLYLNPFCTEIRRVTYKN